MMTEIELALQLCAYSKHVYLVFGMVFGFFLSITIYLLIVEIINKRLFKKES